MPGVALLKLIVQSQVDTHVTVATDIALADNVDVYMIDIIKACQRLVSETQRPVILHWRDESVTFQL